MFSRNDGVQFTNSLPMVPVEKLPARDARGHTVWVTRERPKVDRIACP